MEYDIKRIEFVKTQKTKYVIRAHIFFKSVLIAFFSIKYFLKIIFRYVLTFSVKFFICSVAQRLLSSSVLE